MLQYRYIYSTHKENFLGALKNEVECVGCGEGDEKSGSVLGEILGILQNLVRVEDNLQSF